MADRIMSTVAVLMAIFAVGVSIYEVRLMREYQDISVWPNINLHYNRGYGEQPFFAFVARNDGLGPAIVRDFRVRVDGTPVQNWAQAMQIMTDGKLDLRRAIFDQRGGTSDLSAGKTLLPADEVLAVTVTDPALATDAQFDLERLDAEVCYCSVYGQCWRTRFEDSQSQRVKACNPEPGQAFTPLPPT